MRVFPFPISERRQEKETRNKKTKGGGKHSTTYTSEEKQTLYVRIGKKTKQSIQKKINEKKKRTLPIDVEKRDASLVLAATSVWPANRETYNDTLLPAGTWYLFSSTAGSAQKARVFSRIR